MNFHLIIRRNRNKCHARSAVDLGIRYDKGRNQTEPCSPILCSRYQNHAPTEDTGVAREKKTRYGTGEGPAWLAEGQRWGAGLYDTNAAIWRRWSDRSIVDRGQSDDRGCMLLALPMKTTRYTKHIIQEKKSRNVKYPHIHGQKGEGGGRNRANRYFVKQRKLKIHIRYFGVCFIPNFERAG